MDPIADLRRVSVRLADSTLILGPLNLLIRRGEHWVVLGPNGSGKSTLMQLLSLYLHPSAGHVAILGEELGRTDVRRLRERIGLVSSAMADQLRSGLAAHDVVVTARHGALEPWWHSYSEADHRRADELLALVGCADHIDQPFGTLSEGERQRTLLARALMPDPELLLLDEPAAGLDLAGREGLVDTIATIIADPSSPAVVLVTHHVEEIAPGFDRLLLLREGGEVAAGPLDSTLRSDTLSATFDIDVEVVHDTGRWTARTRSR